MAIDRAAAKTALEEYAGLDDADAEALLSAVVVAAEREALELLAGDAPVPSSLADARALRLRYITESAQRALKPREVEVILRVSSSAALNSLRRMNATYPRAVDSYLKKVVQETSTITKTGDQKSGFRFQIYFDEASGLEYAYQLLQRKGLTHDVRVKRADQVLDLPRKINGQDVLAVLGLKSP
ncbi:MAG: hypothetical protein E6F94_00255 [Actinobacteria bacterium]|nr:MAG: hypothetical protein E6F94_00255 [Actinomycetota bacterium]